MHTTRTCRQRENAHNTKRDDNEGTKIAEQPEQHVGATKMGEHNAHERGQEVWTLDQVSWGAGRGWTLMLVLFF